MFVESALVYGGLLDPAYVVHLSSYLFQLPPHLWRLLTPFLLTGSGFSFVFDLYFSKSGTIHVRGDPADSSGVFTYASGLELNSPRFTQPGDFFIYVVFIASVVWVSLPRVPFPLPISNFFPAPALEHLAYLPAQPFLAEAVPGTEEDYPCGAYSSIFRKTVKRTVCGAGMVAAQLRKAFRNLLIYVLRLELPTSPKSHHNSA